MQLEKANLEIGGYVMSTAIVAGVVIIILFAAIRKIVKDKKHGNSCCQSGCHGCSKCH